MRGVYPVAAVRAAEQAACALVSEGALMQRAATALAVECARLLRGRTGRVYGASVVLLVGTGNNGGDALYAGADLARRGARVHAELVDPARVHAAGLAALRAAGGRIGPPPVAADLVVDGLLGIGGRGGLAGRTAELAAAYQETFTVAVDVPSGVDADTGAVGENAVTADVTLTFGCLKPGVVIAQTAGDVRLVDIGLSFPPAELRVLEEADVRALLPEPGPDDDKYTRGVIGVLAGSAAYPGAGVLATGAAAHGGAGFVRYLGRAAAAVRAAHPEIVVQDGARPGDVRAQAWVIGPGLGTDDLARDLLAETLATDVPVLVDADALTLLARDPVLLDHIEDRAAPTVLTPHDREFLRLCPDASDLLANDRLAAARAVAADLGAVVLLKGNATIVATPEGQAYVNQTGTPWLGTAGTGDVLAGLIGSLLAASVPAPLAAAGGAYVHGLAGQLAAAGGPPTSADVLRALRAAMHVITRG